MWIKYGHGANGVWVETEEGERRFFGDEEYFLVMNADSGNPSWVNEATFERKSRAARREGKKRDIGI